MIKKRPNNSVFFRNGQKLKQPFDKTGYLKANEYMKVFSTISHTKIQIKTTMWYCDTLSK